MKRSRIDRPLGLTTVFDRTAVGGIELLMLNLFRHFDRSVVRPRLVCLKEGGPLADDFRNADVPVDVMDRTGRFDLRTVPRLVRAFRRTGTDIVMVTHPGAPFFLGRVAARFAGCAANLIAPHDMDLVPLGRRTIPRLDLETLFLSDAMVLLAPSQSTYLHEHEGIGRFPWRRLPEVVVPNGIVLPPATSPERRAAARRLLAIPDDAVVLGNVARLAPQKAHHVLLRAFARIVPTRPQAHLVIVGDGPRRIELEKLAAELGIRAQVRFTGVRRDVPDLMPALDVFCLSSIYEGAPLSIIEAMAANVAVMVTDCGALRDMMSDGEEGFLVPVDDVDLYAERLARLVDDPALMRRMGLAGRVRAVRDHRIETMARRFEHLLTTVGRR